MQVIVSADITDQYTIDGLGFWTEFGWMIETGSDDLLQLPKSKEVYFKDWGGENGREYDLSKRFFEDKTATLAGTLIADNEQDFWDKYLSLWELLKSPGTRVLYSTELKQTFGAFYLESPSTKRLTRLTDGSGKVAMKLDVLFQVMFSEFDPPSETPLPPVVNPGPNRIITLPTSQAVLSGASVIPKGGATITTLLWEFVSGPANPSISGSGTLTPTFTGMASAGMYTFRLTATDSNGQTGIATMTVSVNPAAEPDPPLVNAGPDRSITLPTSSATLSGASITPQSGSSITYYAWEPVSYPTFATITGGDTMTPTISGMTVPGQYRFRLFVEDSNGKSASDDVIITVHEGSAGAYVEGGYVENGYVE